MADGLFTKLRRSRSNSVAAALRLAGLTAKVDTPARSDAGVTTVRQFDAAEAAKLEAAVREQVGTSANVELLVTVTWIK